MGVPDVSSSMKKLASHETYASGGGLLAAPINASHLF